MADQHHPITWYIEGSAALGQRAFTLEILHPLTQGLGASQGLTPPPAGPAQRRSRCLDAPSHNEASRLMPARGPTSGNDPDRP